MFSEKHLWNGYRKQMLWLQLFWFWFEIFQTWDKEVTTIKLVWKFQTQNTCTQAAVKPSTQTCVLQTVEQVEIKSCKKENGTQEEFFWVTRQPDF